MTTPERVSDQKETDTRLLHYIKWKEKSFHKALVWSGDIRSFESTHSLDQSLQIGDDPWRSHGQTATFPALGKKSFSSVKAADVI